MSGYLQFSAEESEISDIAKAINDAGDGYHHTEMWSEPIEWLNGVSHTELIQSALNKASDEMKRLRAELANRTHSESEYLNEARMLRDEMAESMRDAKRWRYFADSPQTALMLGSELDPNSAHDWAKECGILADELARYKE